jgi:hypothetical protein
LQRLYCQDGIIITFHRLDGGNVITFFCRFKPITQLKTWNDLLIFLGHNL